MIWIWLWQVADCEGGDIAAIVAKARAHDVGVMVKTHDGGTANPNGQRGFLLIEALRGAGVPLRAWGYCYPGIDADVQAFFAAQADADYIADVEVEYDGHPAAAAALVDALRRKLPDHRIGYAPLPIVSFHDGSGQYEEFNRLDVACPQAYAGTGGRDAIGALTWTEAEWAAAFGRCNIEPAVYAADQDPADLRAALAYVTGTGRRFGNGDVSVWSWQHMTDAHWTVIDEFTHGGLGMDPTFRANWLAVYQEIGVAALFDQLKDIQAAQAEATGKLAAGEAVDRAELDAIAAALAAVGDRIAAARAAAVVNAVLDTGPGSSPITPPTP